MDSLPVSEDKLVFYGYSVLTAILCYWIFADIYVYLVLLGILHVAYTKLQHKYVKYVDAEGRAVFITGCDTGFGHETAKRMSDRGFTVFAGCLMPDGDGANELRGWNSKLLHVVDLDVTDEDSIQRAVNVIKELMPSKGLWAVMNNAAINLLSDIELTPIEQMQKVSDVNYYGIVRVTKAVLPLLRKTKGRVVNVTSVKGRVALASDVSYIPTKWAGEAFSDILRREMKKFGVTVAIIEPGQYGGTTGMLNEQNVKRVVTQLNANWNEASDDVKQAYGRNYVDEQVKGFPECGKGSAKDVTPVIDAMEDAIANEKPKYRYLIHGGCRYLDWYCICAVMNQFLPEWVVDKFIDMTDPQPRAAKQII